MKHLARFLFTSPCIWLFRTLLSIRYRFCIKGLGSLPNSDTTLFLCNHPSYLIDPLFVGVATFKQYKVRPVVVEEMYRLPFFHFILWGMDAIPLPAVHHLSHLEESHKSQRAIAKIVHDLKKGDNFQIFPGGEVKSKAHEKIEGTSLVSKILEETTPHIVLVRTTGMWGSMFSKALTGSSPSILSNLWKGLKIALKNGLFFVPKRDVLIEFESAPPDFPFKGSRMEINAYLEKYYGEEPLVLVSYSAFKEEYPQFKSAEDQMPLDHFDLSQVPLEVQDKVLHKLSALTGMPRQKIATEMTLAKELGLDSIDAVEIGVFLAREFKVDVRKIPVNRVITVKSLIGLAANLIHF